LMGKDPSTPGQHQSIGRRFVRGRQVEN
jgi:hypothetical protein